MNENKYTDEQIKEIIEKLTSTVAYNKARVDKLARLIKRESANKWSVAKSVKIYRRLSDAQKELGQSQAMIDQIIMQSQSKL